MTLNFRPAQRSSAKPLIGLYSESGGGKTYSGLVLARGFVGPNGKIGMIETEGGRGESYADPSEYPEIGGYSVLPLRASFAPIQYFQALQTAEKASLDALIIDSASHEWTSTGGVLDMAAQNQAEGKKGVLVWQMPKIEHQRHFILPLLATPIPLIVVCMRAKYPMIQIKKPNGSTDWVRSDILEPQQSDDILFEIFAHGWIDHEHKFHLTQCRSKSMQAIFEKVEPLTNTHGEALARWAKGASAPAPSPAHDASSETSAGEPAAPVPAEAPIDRMRLDGGAQAGESPGYPSNATPEEHPCWGKHWTPERWGTALTLALNRADSQEQFDDLRRRAMPSFPAYKEWSAAKYDALMVLITEKQTDLLNQGG